MTAFHRPQRLSRPRLLLQPRGAHSADSPRLVAQAATPTSDAGTEGPDTGEPTTARHSGYGIAPATERLLAFIRDVPDFPKPGILFRDITPLLANADAFRCALEQMVTPLLAEPIDAVVAIEARGFLLGSPLALRLGVPLLLARKPGKLPSARFQVSYALEYASTSLELHEGLLERNARVLIVDDVLATGGTAAAAASLVRRAGGDVAGYTFLMELTALGGRAGLGSAPVWSLLKL